MQKTFKINRLGDKYKVIIKPKSKLVHFIAGSESINFYFGNPKYINAETEYLTNFLEYRLAISKANEIKNYILNNVMEG
jgi:hypothetical protein